MQGDRSCPDVVSWTRDLPLTKGALYQCPLTHSAEWSPTSQNAPLEKLTFAYGRRRPFRRHLR